MAHDKACDRAGCPGPRGALTRGRDGLACAQKRDCFSKSIRRKGGGHGQDEVGFPRIRVSVRTRYGAAGVRPGNTANKAGAIYSIGWNLVIRNSTISGNHATDSIGGIKLEFAYASIYNSTITGNTAAFQFGGTGGVSLNNTQLDLVSTIVAGNTDVTGASDLKRLNGTVNASYSLFEQLLPFDAINGTNTANLIGDSPMLGPLAANGGPTDTHALPLGSPAIDTGADPLGLGNDQRGPGFVRVNGVVADIGAFEYGSGVQVPVLSGLGMAALALVLLALGAVVLLRRA